MDEKIYGIDELNELEITVIPLNIDKKIYLMRAFEDDFEKKKKYIRSACIIVNNTILTSTFSDTIHFFEELNLFEYSNSQNKYLSITEYKSTKNLKLICESEDNIFISKSEAKAIYKLFNLSFIGYSMSRVLEFEFRLTAQHMTQLVYDNKLILK